jgi:hypothetical protein
LDTGANGSLAPSRARQAAAASGWVPPVGSHRSVQCSALAVPPVILISRDTLGGAAGEAAGAAVLPQAVAAAEHITAIRR